MSNNKWGLRDVDVRGKRVLVRCDFNVPIDRDDKNKILDDTRIKRSLPTIRYLIEGGAKVILCSHLGKASQGLNLIPVAKRLEELLHMTIFFFRDITEMRGSLNMGCGEVAILDNLRLFGGEELNDDSFVRKLVEYMDIYVNDAFGSYHRPHASIVGIPKYLPSYPGFLVEEELKQLEYLTENPERPFVAIVGGGKPSTKIGLLLSLVDKVDVLIIAPALAYTFILAMGGRVGNSIVEPDKLEIAKEIMQKANKKGVKIILSNDVLTVKEVRTGAESITCNSFNIPDGYIGVDIGEETIQVYKKEVAKAKTVFWNGPVGVFEIPDFAKGTNSIAEMLAMSGAKTYIGGGDCISAVNHLGLEEQMTYISTGGGATLQLLEGKKLPGIVALENCKLR